MKFDEISTFQLRMDQRHDRARDFSFSRRWQSYTHVISLLFLCIEKLTVFMAVSFNYKFRTFFHFFLSSSTSYIATETCNANMIDKSNVYDSLSGSPRKLHIYRYILLNRVRIEWLANIHQQAATMSTVHKISFERLHLHLATLIKII